MTINTTLDSFLYANTVGFNPDYGKITPRPSGSLISREINQNMEKLISIGHSIVITEDSETTVIEYNATFVIKNEGVTLKLGLAAYQGCEIRIIALAPCSVEYTSKKGTITLVLENELKLTWLNNFWEQWPVIRDDLINDVNTWSSSKIAKHSLPLIYDSGQRENSNAESYKLSNVNVGDVNLLLSTRFGDEVEISIGTTANNQYIQAKRNFNISDKIKSIHMDGADLYVTMNTYFDYFRIYHKTGVLSDDFAVSYVSSVPSTATEINIKGISVSNVDQTNIKMNEAYAAATSGGHGCRYVVRNGICYVNMDLRMVANGQICTLPKPIMTIINIPMPIFTTDLTDIGTGNGLLIIESDGSAKTWGAKLNNTRYMLNFSYPIE